MEKTVGVPHFSRSPREVGSGQLASDCRFDVDQLNDIWNENTLTYP